MPNYKCYDLCRQSQMAISIGKKDENTYKVCNDVNLYNHLISYFLIDEYSFNHEYFLSYQLVDYHIFLSFEYFIDYHL